MDQSQALAILKSGRNAFLTGSAGTGKTFVLNDYIRYLKERKVPVAVTASTGIAATHMNGMTIHAWSGIGVKNSLSSSDLLNMQSKKYLQKNLKEAQVLIIDEISMLHKNQLNMVDEVLRFFRESDNAFGGVQVILSGDFFQLPPIGNHGESNKEKFAFMSQSWLNAKLAVCYLTEQYRQSDQQLNTILNEIRSGQISPHSIRELQSSKETKLEAQNQPTKMYTHNIDVDKINKEHLLELPEEMHLFKAVTKGNKKLIESLKKSVLADENLQLKKFAKIMFVKNNYDKGFVNGTLGQIIDFSDDNFPIVKTYEEKNILVEPEEWSMENDIGKNLASFSQLPIRLAWAITIHKSQGMTLDAAEIDLSKTFEEGQGYVALSRLKSLQGLQLKGFNSKALQVASLAAKADKRFQELSTEVEHSLPDEKTQENQALDFIKKCGGITDPDEIERFSKRAKEKKMPKKSTYLFSKEYIEKGLSLEEISKERGLTNGTISGHIVKIKEIYPETDISRFRPDEKIMEMVISARDKLEARKNPKDITSRGQLSSKAFFDAMNGEVSYNDIKLAMAFL
ncbi:MAG: helicase [Calditrichaeota bacterium]|nr:MAG: helicase [Calditrichota bacterium]MBL1206032.1 helicase [Calditrichota bacterium]NOG45860.1 AAA family ATPase [Calditrichota bacterium]